MGITARKTKHPEGSHTRSRLTGDRGRSESVGFPNWINVFLWTGRTSGQFVLPLKVLSRLIRYTHFWLNCSGGFSGHPQDLPVLPLLSPPYTILSFLNEWTLIRCYIETILLVYCLDLQGLRLFGDTKHVVRTEKSHLLFCKPRETVWARNPRLIIITLMPCVI